MVLDVMRALGRRWYVLLVGMLITSGLVAGAYAASPPEYNARALVLLLPPQTSLGQGGNPFLQLSGLEQPAAILSAYFSSASAQTEVGKVSPTAEYEVGIDDSTRGPVIVVDVTDRSRSDTLNVLDHFLTQIPAELALLQQQLEVKRGAAVSSMPLVVDRDAKRDVRGTIRLMVAALVAGVVATGVGTFAFDGFLQRRNLRRSRGQSAPAIKERPLAPAAVPAAVPSARSSLAQAVRTNGWDQPDRSLPAPSGGVAPKANGRAARNKSADTGSAAWSWGGPDS